MNQSTMNPNLIPGAGIGGTRCGWQREAGGQYSRFGRIHGLGPMPDVLGAVEDSKGQATQEVPRGKQAGHRSEAETSASWEAKEKENSKPLTAEPEGSKDLYIGMQYLQLSRSMGAGAKQTWLQISAPTHSSWAIWAK